MGILNTSISIKSMKLHNRLVMPPMATAKARSDGKVTEQLCDYYAEKSKGGYIGLIITEHSYVSLEGKASKGQLSISNDDDIEGLTKLVSIIHKNNTKVMAQISHAGGATEEEITGYAPLSASSIKLPRATDKKLLPKEMTKADIDKVITDFAYAATRAKKAGFDGIEIHSAHGYLLNQFFSPLTNKRNDEYSGNTIDGRIKLHLQIIKAIRNTVGNEYPVALRLGACDYMNGGTTISDSILAVKKFEIAGIDLIDISGGFCGYTHPEVKEQGYFSELSEAIKKNVSIPVILTGGIVEAITAERLLTNKKADLIGVGRAILKNSEWAKNAILSKN
ncbi:NADH:flavin oxidoreductase [Clostridium sp. SYSU_GA19001]|uniref:NADH:flavin oxidoreductase n=1 Tax=Clostridium caldaquaticum TaxID=2940653 RepID=UPI0020774217|nr:NADH:flavin oxidoreductase [Clostridium caldaquaticum]MCM8711516.1 NADH:flavin oxidoreductase [Clostridium caldaquaticum]